MKKILIVLLAVSFWPLACNKKLTSPKMTIEAQAVGDMPAEALNVDRYWIRLSRVDTAIVLVPPDPLAVVDDPYDSLGVWFNYKAPTGSLPQGELAFDRAMEIPIPNTDNLWDSDNDANARFKQWVLLDPGHWQAFVIPENSAGRVAIAASYRYDFLVDSALPLPVFIRGLLY